MEEYQADVEGHTARIRRSGGDQWEITIDGRRRNRQVRTTELAEVKAIAHAFAHSVMRYACRCTAELEWRAVKAENRAAGDLSQ